MSAPRTCRVQSCATIGSRDMAEQSPSKCVDAGENRSVTSDGKNARVDPAAKHLTAKEADELRRVRVAARRERKAKQRPDVAQQSLRHFITPF